ncbi:MAG: amino acid ABC transporter substrate-binding protein [Paraglaciecola sp.]|nr:amino acid ABC transporter substrate-binding protein [Paraglaciecola sp.]NCT49657.1 amino acid ABC transporter substrate-binding protein [Paraglaciecola sp.]
MILQYVSVTTHLAQAGKGIGKWMIVLLSSFFCAQNQAKTLLVIAGWDKPPYIITEQNKGFEVELMQHILASLGHDVQMLYVPYGRTYATLLREKADIGMTLAERSGVEPSVLSQPYVTYQNVAVSFKHNTKQITQIGDLQFVSVVAFQSAKTVLGEAFNQMATKNTMYIELPDQRSQVELFWLGNIDAVVMDVNIFGYFSQVSHVDNWMERVDIHEFFPPTQYSAAIPDAELREAFNQALDRFKQQPAYFQLLEKYSLFVR